MSDGFSGDYVESRSAELVLEKIDAKLRKIVTGSYRPYSKQTLVVYDNSGYFYSSPDLMVSIVAAGLPSTQMGETFAEIYVLTGAVVAKLPWNGIAHTNFFVPDNLVIGSET